MPEIIDSITGDVVPGAMETILIPAHDYDLDRRIAATYREAMKLSCQGARVSIAVGEGVAAYLRSLCTIPDSALTSAATFFGFPVHVLGTETWTPPEHIEVRATTVIA